MATQNDKDDTTSIESSFNNEIESVEAANEDDLFAVLRAPSS